MKPKNVIWHEHFFPTDDWEKDECRVDAVQLKTGEYGVWDVDEDSFMYVESLQVARATAWTKAKKKKPGLRESVEKIKAKRRKPHGLDRS